MTVSQKKQDTVEVRFGLTTGKSVKLKLKLKLFDAWRYHAETFEGEWLRSDKAGVFIGEIITWEIL